MTRFGACFAVLRCPGRCVSASGRPGLGGAERPRSGAAGALDAGGRERIVAGGGEGTNLGARLCQAGPGEQNCVCLGEAGVGEEVQSRRVRLAQLTAVWMWTPSRLARSKSATGSRNRSSRSTKARRRPPTRNRARSASRASARSSSCPHRWAPGSRTPRGRRPRTKRHQTRHDHRTACSSARR